MTDYWKPKVGDLVWMNYPDADEPEGRVVGFVPNDAPGRAGQPVIERVADFPPPGSPPSLMGLRYKKGDRVVIHPAFLLPFRHGGEEWKQAEREGRIGGG